MLPFLYSLDFLYYYLFFLYEDMANYFKNETCLRSKKKSYVWKLNYTHWKQVTQNSNAFGNIRIQKLQKVSSWLSILLWWSLLSFRKRIIWIELTFAIQFLLNVYKCYSIFSHFSLGININFWKGLWTIIYNIVSKRLMYSYFQSWYLQMNI